MTERKNHPNTDERYVCNESAIWFRDKSLSLGWKSALVYLTVNNKSIRHILNAFETSDKGVVFIDHSDIKSYIAYAQIGKPYGLIDADIVRSDIVSLSADPSEPIKTIERVNYAEDIFCYQYFEQYYKIIDSYFVHYTWMLANLKKLQKNGLTYLTWKRNLAEIKKSVIDDRFILMDYIIKDIEVLWLNNSNNRLNNAGLIKPTWETLKSFLIEDKKMK